MSTIKLEIPAGDKLAAELFGTALLQYAGVAAVPVELPAHEVLSTEEIDQLTGGNADDSTPGEAGAPSPAPAGDVRVDKNGVPFNAEMCSDATDPFYKSGGRFGQWKKRKPVSWEEYDAWYAAEKGKAAGAAPASAPVDPAAAFGGTPSAPPAPPASTGFKDYGTYITWTAEQKAAGAIEQKDVDEAHAAVGVVLSDLFPVEGGPTQAQVEERLAKCTEFLVTRGAQPPAA